MTVPRSARLVSSSGASDETFTVSVKPTPSCTLTVATWPTSSRMSLRMFFWNPLISTVRV